MSPVVYVIAGPNGAGKTTFAKTYLPKYAGCKEFLNADLIAAGISPLAPEAAAMAAGQVMLARMREFIDERRTFGFETTLAGRSYVPLLKNMTDLGYETELFFLWLPSVEMALERVKQRVRNGGHDIPESVIARRYRLGKRNLFGLYLPLFDRWTMLDNSRTLHEKVARGTRLKLEIVDDFKYALISDATHE